MRQQLVIGTLGGSSPEEGVVTGQDDLQEVVVAKLQVCVLVEVAYRVYNVLFVYFSIAILS